jgi:hypothetical protein
MTTRNRCLHEWLSLLLYYHKVAYTSLFVLLGVTDNIVDHETYIVI